jgi:hypothetical protein
MQTAGSAFSSTAAARLVIGLGQGIALHLLYLAAENGDWPATHGMVFAPLLLDAWFVPVILLLGLGNMRLRTLVAWGLAATCGSRASPRTTSLAARRRDRTGSSRVPRSRQARAFSRRPSWCRSSPSGCSSPRA